MTTNIFAIHGAFSSPRIFKYLSSQMGKRYRWYYLDYQTATAGITDIIRSVNPMENAHVVGHSMGGLIALGLANKPWVNTITTISTPLGGLDVNIIQSYWTRSEFIKEISSHGEFISNIRKTPIKQPVQHLISTTGFNPFIWENSDGVVTVRSQRVYALGPVVDIHANHTEIMLDDLTITTLQNFWNKNTI
jgi:pimeloyl-ACP methyl ester carboxylesterase